MPASLIIIEGAALIVVAAVVVLLRRPRPWRYASGVAAGGLLLLLIKLPAMVGLPDWLQVVLVVLGLVLLVGAAVAQPGRRPPVRSGDDPLAVYQPPTADPPR